MRVVGTRDPSRRSSSRHVRVFIGTAGNAGNATLQRCLGGGVGGLPEGVGAGGLRDLRGAAPSRGSAALRCLIWARSPRLYPYKDELGPPQAGPSRPLTENMPIEKLVELVKQLTLEEKCNLLSGKDTWRTCDVPRLGIPSVKVYEGHCNGPDCSFLTVRTELVAIPSSG